MILTKPNRSSIKGQRPILSIMYNSKMSLGEAGVMT